MWVSGREETLICVYLCLYLGFVVCWRSPRDHAQATQPQFITNITHNGRVYTSEDRQKRWDCRGCAQQTKETQYYDFRFVHHQEKENQNIT